MPRGSNMIEQNGLEPLSNPSEALFSTKCATKILMHALKYPAQRVCGIVLGKKPIEATGPIHFADTVPLFHTRILSPMMKLGMELVENHCLLNKSYGIVGFYYVDLAIDTQRPPELGLQCEQIADTIQSKYPDLAVCLMNMKDANQADECSLRLFFKKGIWTPSAHSNVKYESDFQQTLTLAFNLLLSADLSDLDDHLSCASADPFNSNLNEKILAVLEEKA